MTLLNGGLFPETIKLLLEKLLISPLGFLLARMISEKKFRRNLTQICAYLCPRKTCKGFWQLINTNNGLAVFHKLIGYMQRAYASSSRWAGRAAANNSASCLIDGIEDPSRVCMVTRYRELVGKQPITELQGVGHYPQVEAPALVLQAFRSFMTDLRSR